MFARQALTYWLGLGPDAKMATLDVDPRTNVAGDKLVAMVNHAMGPGETKDPAKLLPLIQQGRKLIIYHGTSDPAIPAARSIMYYQQLEAALHGQRHLALEVVGQPEQADLAAVVGRLAAQPVEDVLEEESVPGPLVLERLPAVWQKFSGGVTSIDFEG